MGFYEELMQCYEEVFPLAPMKLHWLKGTLEDIGAKNLLDIGCATGDLCGHLTDVLDQVDGFDLDEAMIEKAATKYRAKNLRFRTGDMLEVQKVFRGMTYDVITCFGNTLVHVQQGDLESVFEGVKASLKSGGLFIGQILNYDHVLDAPIKELPPIDNPRVAFKRSYEWLGEDQLDFKTVLTIKMDGSTFRNTITLYPIRKKQLEDTLLKAGFSTIRFYKNYKGEPAGGGHLPLIFVAE